MARRPLTFAALIGVPATVPGSVLLMKHNSLKATSATAVEIVSNGGLASGEERIIIKLARLG